MILFALLVALGTLVVGIAAALVLRRLPSIRLQLAGLGLLIWFPRWWSARRAEREAEEEEGPPHDRSGELAPETIG